MGILIFGAAVVLPYMLEQYTYWRYTSKQAQPSDLESGIKKVTGYGWAYVWDAALTAVVIPAGYRIIKYPESLGTLDWLGIAIFLVGTAARILGLPGLWPVSRNGAS